MKNIIKSFSIALAILLGFGLMPALNVLAEEEAPVEAEATAEEPVAGEGESAEITPAPAGTRISLKPTSKILQIASGSVYDEVFEVSNDGSEPLKIEVYAAPYSYVYSNEEDLYKLGFSNENNFTQLSRWITFRNADGDYVEKANFTIEPGATLGVAFRISTPANIPSGGQYAVIFAHSLSEEITGVGIRTEASPGIVVYGRSTEGEAITSAEISNLTIEQKSVDGKNTIVASAKVKNTGNVDFTAVGSLKVEPIIGFGSYESPVTSGRMSIIPEAELAVSDAWIEAPSFGIYKATWTVTVNETAETIERVIFMISPMVIIITIIVLTIIVISVIMTIRKRKERRSRLSA